MNVQTEHLNISSHQKANPILYVGSLFAPISRQEAELIQQQAPPSYGQLIAQGIIPPVEDFPTENPNEVRKKGPNVCFHGFLLVVFVVVFFFFIVVLYF